MSTDAPLVPLLRLAGFALAHALWSVSEGEPLCPLALAETGAQRNLIRFEGATEDVIPGARTHLAECGAERWVLVWDGYVTAVTEERQGDRLDALIADLSDPASATRLGAVVRYRPRTDETPFCALGPVQLFSDDGSPLSLDGAMADHLRLGLREHPALASLPWEQRD